MRRIAAVAIPALLLLSAGLLTLNQAFVALAVPFVAMIFVDGLLLVEPGRLTVTRFVETRRLEEGDTTWVRVRVENAGPSLRDVTVRDIVPFGLEVVRKTQDTFSNLPQGESLEFSYAVRVPRGYFVHQAVSVTYRGGLGLIEKSQDYRVSSEVFGVPRPQSLRQIAFRPRSTLLNSGAHPARVGGTGLEFFDIRRYMPGDRMRHVNWRATGRRWEELYINDFEQERVADIALILDARSRAYALSKTFHASVHAAATLAQHFSGEGNRISLLVYGGAVDWTPPGFGKRHYERISRALAKAKIGDNQVFSDFGGLPRRLFPGSIQLALISPVLKDDVGYIALLRRHGYGVLVVSPDAVEAEAAEGDLENTEDQNIRWALRFERVQRRAIVRSLRREGVLVVDWRPTDSLADVLYRETRAFAAAGRMR